MGADLRLVFPGKGPLMRPGNHWFGQSGGASMGGNQRLLGAHMSIAGGLERAVAAAQSLGMTTFQIFTHSPSQWSVSAKSTPLPANPTWKNWAPKPLDPGQIRAFVEAKSKGGFDFAVAHDSYLINLGAVASDLFSRSVAAFISELEKGEALGLCGVVTHPGAHLTQTVEDGLKRVAQGLNEAHKATRGLKTKTLLETTAGQGTSLGWNLEHFETLLNLVKEPERVEVCLDTCHLFAAGYGLGPGDGLETTLESLDRYIGWKKIALIHVNDSLKKQGSRVDRHAHLGQGCIGLKSLKAFLTQPGLAPLPLILETPKEEDDQGRPMDEVNLEILKSFDQPA